MKKLLVLFGILAMMSFTNSTVNAAEKCPILSEEAYAVERDYLNGAVHVKDIFDTYSIEAIEEYVENYKDIDDVSPLVQGLEHPDQLNLIENPYVKKTVTLRMSRKKREDYEKRTDLKPLKNQALLELEPLDDYSVYAYEMVYRMEDTITDSIWDEKPGSVKVYNLCKICGNEAYVAWDGGYDGPDCNLFWSGMCENCGYEAHRSLNEMPEDEVNPDLIQPHEYVVERIQPTCYEEGKVITTCINCLDEKIDILPMLSHEYVEEVENKPTFFKGGKVEEKCKYCGEVKNTYEIPSKLRDFTNRLIKKI